MTDPSGILNEIEPLVEQHFEDGETFIPGETTVRLSRPTYDVPEVLEALDSLLSTWVTMGEKVERFEERWSEYVGTKSGVMVNSGSSANLLALKMLTDNKIEPGDEVIVPAVSWSTSVFPILDIDAKPVFVDVNMDTFTIDIEATKEAISGDTAAILPVHLLGNPCDMNAIMDLCTDYGLALVEDCCEAHGATFDGKHVGSFGVAGTFSFFFSHHISTIEGGMVTVDSEAYDDRLRMSRAHGWIRDIEVNNTFAEQYSDIDERFLFARRGYNLRPTEIQGAFGIHQMDRLEEFVEIRRDNAAYLNQELAEFDDHIRLLEERSDTRCSWFAYPIVIRRNAPFTRADFREHLEENLIETRPILAGNMARQPVFDSCGLNKATVLETADHIHELGIFIGNHHRLTQAKLDYIVEAITSFIAENT